MTKNRAFEAVFETTDGAFKLTRPAENARQFKNIFQGNGEMIKLTDVTEETPISLSHLEKTLKRAEYGRREIEIIIALIQYNYENIY